MRNYSAPSSRLALSLLIGASSCWLLGCTLFEPESHWQCFKPDCSPIDSGTSGIDAAGRDAGNDADVPDSSRGGTGDSGSGSQDSGGAVSACTDCDADQICDEAGGKCVQCLGNDDCKPPTPVCTVDHRCVACTLDHHCPSTAPACNDDNTCVGCTDSTLHCGGDSPLCDGARHECVQCIDDADCPTAAAAHCNDGTCVPCTGPLHCAHLDGLGICDTSSGAGECVQCTGALYTACGTADSGTPYVCDSARKICTNELASSALACQPCVADAQCAAGMACMQTKFGTTDTGSYCLWKQDATGASAPNGDCLTVRPFVGTESGWSSVDGESAVVCKPAVTSCQAQMDFRAKSCSGATVGGNAECGAAGVDDAFCAPFGPSQHRCTVPCVSYDDCKETRPGDDMECQSQTLGGQMVSVCQFQ